ncbi:MAG: ABC transporter ATP-binding protein, partial [Thermoplasmatales archaeon]
MKKAKKNKGKTLKTIWFFLNNYKLYFIFLVGMAVITGFLAALNVAVVYALISLVQGTEIASNVFLDIIVNPIINLIPLNNTIVSYSIIFIFIACFAFAFKLLYYFYSVKFVSIVAIETKQEVFNKCIYSDYQFFVDNKQGEIIYNTSSAPLSIADMLQIMSDLFAELF